MRKTVFIATITISFVAVAIFGFIAIGTEGCIATNGGACPAAGNFTIVEFYLTAFKSFSTSVTQLALLVAFLVAIAVVIKLSISQLPQPIVVRSSRDQQLQVSFSLPLQRKLQRWLMLQSVELNLSQ